MARAGRRGRASKPSLFAWARYKRRDPASQWAGIAPMSLLVEPNEGSSDRPKCELNDDTHVRSARTNAWWASRTDQLASSMISPASRTASSSLSSMISSTS